MNRPQQVRTVFQELRRTHQRTRRAATTGQPAGAMFATCFTLTLDEALRAGAIVPGPDLDETEVRTSEALAPLQPHPHPAKRR